MPGLSYISDIIPTGNILVPTPNAAAIAGYINLGIRHRVKRGGFSGALGKMLIKLGIMFKKLCLIPFYGTLLCPSLIIAG